MKGEGDTGAQGHNNSRGYSSNPWKNAFLGFEYILVFMCLCCRMLGFEVTCIEFSQFPFFFFFFFELSDLQSVSMSWDLWRSKFG